MSNYILDTDTLSLEQRGTLRVCQQINSRPIQELALTTLTLQEQMEGWLGLLARARTPPALEAAHDYLVSVLLPSWRKYPVLSFDQPAILRDEQLVKLRLNVGHMDLKIAAIALETQRIVVTRNRRDFGRVPNLVIEDWSV